MQGALTPRTLTPPTQLVLDTGWVHHLAELAALLGMSALMREGTESRSDSYAKERGEGGGVIFRLGIYSGFGGEQVDSRCGKFLSSSKTPRSSYMRRKKKRSLQMDFWSLQGNIATTSSMVAMFIEWTFFRRLPNYVVRGKGQQDNMIGPQVLESPSSLRRSIVFLLSLVLLASRSSLYILLSPSRPTGFLVRGPGVVHVGR